MTIDSAVINFDKGNGLIPVCVQDYETLQVLMLGYMNLAAFEQTLQTGKVTFYSRTKARLWVKGETSGHYLELKELALDCDRDSLLCLVKPYGPTCHIGQSSCFELPKTTASIWYWLSCLVKTIQLRAQQTSTGTSYTQQLLTAGLPRAAQKVGEEGVEVALAAVVGTEEQLTMEVVDLLYHLFVLLLIKNIPLQAIANIIQVRHES